MRKVSAKLSKEMRRYYVLRDEFLTIDRPCGLGVYGCTGYADDVHHKKGRGKFLNDVETWMGVCRSCHTWIHEHPNEARRRKVLLT